LVSRERGWLNDLPVSWHGALQTVQLLHLLTASPRPPSWIQGALLLRLLLLKGGEGERGGKGEEGRGGEDPEKLCTPKNSLE